MTSGSYFLWCFSVSSFKMSRTRVICGNMSVPDSLAFDLGSRLCNSDVLTLFSHGHGPLLYGGPGSAPSNRYGWLPIFRSCIKILSSRTRSGCPNAFSSWVSFFRTLVYRCYCISVRPISNLVSFLGGRLWAISLLKRRNINGRRIVCNFFITLSCLAALSKLEVESLVELRVREDYFVKAFP
jgi:hypothetical protein